jgi:malonyl-CoA O-methyltransferase
MDKKKVGVGFSRAARHYDDYAWLPQDLAVKLLRLLSSDGRGPRNILDIGCGTGALVLSLSKRFPSAKITGFDLASGMVNVAKDRNSNSRTVFLLADLERMPFRADTFDMAVSNSVYQLSKDLESAFQKVNKILMPGGKFYLSVVTQGTLCELQSSFTRACKKNKPSYPAMISRRPAASEVIKALKSSGFKVVRKAGYKKIKYYSSAAEIIKWLKSMGANYSYRNWIKGLNARTVLADTETYYRAAYGRNGRIPATFCGLIIEAEKL